MSPNEINNLLLVKMLEAKNEFVSGSFLAELTGISRVSVRDHIEKLKTDGFEFEAIRNRGYRLKKEPEAIHPDLIRAYLGDQATELPIIFFKEIDSTNTEAERQLANGASTPLLIVAKSQNQGRGRHGRVWHSESSGNIYMTFAFKPNLSPQKVPLFGLWAACQLCKFLNERYALPVQVKWPNDLMYKGKKICGMLAEARIDSDHTRDLIFGIGINVNGDTTEWPEELKTKASTLEALSNKHININAFAAGAIDQLLKSYKLFIDNKHESVFTSLWRNHDYLYGKDITSYMGQKELKGKAMGIAENGALKVQLDSGEIRELQSGEISLSKPF